MTIGEKIKAARNAKNLTVEELSARSGVDNKLIEKYEDNQIRPKYATLNKLADALDVKPVELYNDKNDKANRNAAAELHGDETTESKLPFDLLHKFAEILKDLRMYGNVSQEELADSTGVSAEEIARIECEEAIPDIITLYNIAKHFGVSTDFILGKVSVSDRREGLQNFALSIEQLSELHTKEILCDDLYFLCRNAVIAESAMELCEW